MDDSGVSVTQRAPVAAVGLLLVVLAALGALPPGAGASPVVRVWLCLDERVTIAGTPGADRIVGTRGRDVIFGRGGDDVILGGDGNDVICGGAGDDELDGRYGFDVVTAARGDDHVLGGPGNDLLLGGAGHDRLEGGSDRADSDTLVGGDGRDSLLGGDGSGDHDFLFGGPDADQLDGGLGGRDELYGGEDDDVLANGLVSFEFSPNPVVVEPFNSTAAMLRASGDGQDRIVDADALVGSDFGDRITDGAASSVLRGRGGDDLLQAADGADRVDGGPGSDDLAGGPGADVLSFADSPEGVTASLLDGTAGDSRGNDALSGFESLVGSFFDDVLVGDDGPNEISGSFGRNAVYALDGADYVSNAFSGDAGAGMDECVLANVANCEMEVVVDGYSLPFVAEPEQAVPIDHLGVVSGGIADGFVRPEDMSRVLVSVRRLTADGCSWWDADRSRFVLAACGVPIENPVRVRDGEWRVRVDEWLPPGAYEVAVTWPNDDMAPRCTPAIGRPTCVRFDVR